MTGPDWLHFDAVAMRDGIARHEIDGPALVDAALTRAKDMQNVLNPFVSIREDAARLEAQAAQAALKRGATLGPLHGVPVVLKDMTPTQGDVWTEGSRLFDGRAATHDALIAARLKAAGAIVIGKTTTPEFAWSGRTDSPLWGVTRNPWNADYSAGGSSGGTAVAVATGCAPLGEGSDMGGSIRIPASACNLIGLKPSWGRVPFDGAADRFDPLAHWGPLARSCRDAALFLDVVQGRNNADIAGAPPPVAFLEGLAAPVTGCRVALSVDLGCYAVEPAIAENLRATAERLRARGVIVDDVSLKIPAEATATWDREWAVWLAFNYGDAAAGREEMLSPDVRRLIEIGRRVSALELRAGEWVRTRMAHALQPVLERYDALLCPTLARDVPPAEGAYASPPPDAEGRLRETTMTGMFNLLPRLPVLSVPSGFAPSGLPTGMQIVGRPGADLRVLQIGQLLGPCEMPEFPSGARTFEDGAAPPC